MRCGRWWQREADFGFTWCWVTDPVPATWDGTTAIYQTPRPLAKAVTVTYSKILTTPLLHPSPGECADVGMSPGQALHDETWPRFKSRHRPSAVAEEVLEDDASCSERADGVGTTHQHVPCVPTPGNSPLCGDALEDLTGVLIMPHTGTFFVCTCDRLLNGHTSPNGRDFPATCCTCIVGKERY